MFNFKLYNIFIYYLEAQIEIDIKLINEKS